MNQKGVVVDSFIVRGQLYQPMKARKAHDKKEGYTVLLSTCLQKFYYSRKKGILVNIIRQVTVSLSS